MSVRLTKEQKEERAAIIIQLRDEGKTKREVAECLGITFDSLRNFIRRNAIVFSIELDRQCKYCNKPYTTTNKLSEHCSSNCYDEDYHRTKRSRAERQCKQCSNLFSPKGEQRVYCSSDCREQHRINMQQLRDEQRQKELNEKLKLKGIRKLHKALVKALNRNTNKTRTCVYCGKEYNSNNIKYCSDECKRVVAKERHKMKKRYGGLTKEQRLSINGKADYTINIGRLHERDNGCCHICGGHTDFNDYRKTAEGYFIAGNNYPSIDHVIPIAKGGLHQWDNVKLAHRICNSLKQDKIITNIPSP